MKKYLIIIILINLALVSCAKSMDEGLVREQYIYQNDSGYDLKIIRFFTKIENGNLLTKRDSIFITNTASYTEENRIRLPGNGSNDSLTIFSDSLYLIYDSNRILKLYALDNQNVNYPYSILNSANYQTIASGDNDLKIAKYTFTNADYNEAQ